jgi:large subunit ribosomal protein L33
MRKLHKVAMLASLSNNSEYSLQQILDRMILNRQFLAKFKVLRLRRYRMAKTNTIVVKLLSTADTGYYYVAKKNPRTQTEKLEFRKYDPVARKHVAFREAKIK